MEKKQLKKYFLDAILINSASEETKEAFEKYLDHDILFSKVSKSFRKFLSDLRLTDLSDDEENLVLYLYTDSLVRKILPEVRTFDYEGVYKKFKVKNRNPLLHTISLNINPLISSKIEFQRLIDSSEFEHRFLFYLFYRNDQKDKDRKEFRRRLDVEIAKRIPKTQKLSRRHNELQKRFNELAPGAIVTKLYERLAAEFNYSSGEVVRRTIARIQKKTKK